MTVPLRMLWATAVAPASVATDTPLLTKLTALPGAPRSSLSCNLAVPRGF
jgi:hypothetical protein